MSARRPILLAIFWLLSLPLRAQTITTAAELQRRQYSCVPLDWAPFVITGRVNEVLHDEPFPIILEDASGRALVYGTSTSRPRAGTRIVIAGAVNVSIHNHVYRHWCRIDSCTTLGSADIPKPRQLSIAELDPDRHALLRVRISGRIAAIEPDEVDPRLAFVLLRSKGRVLPVSCPRRHLEAERDLLGQKVEIVGTYHSFIDGVRTFTQPYVEISRGDGIRLLDKADAPVPLLENVRHASPEQIARLDMRQVEGTVLATWQPNQYMLQTDDGQLVKVRHRESSPHPHVGDVVCAQGFPETDLYTIVFTCASCAPTTNRLANTSRLAEAPLAITPRSVLTDPSGNPCVTTDKHVGKLVRTSGRVRDIRTQQGGTALLVEQDGLSLPVDVSDYPAVRDGISVGSMVEVTGLCVLDAETWTPMNAMPRLKSYMVVIRSPEDVRVLARPSWWTPTRLTYAIGGLLLALVGFAVWNRLLNRLVRKRSAALVAEQRASTEASLKIDERTRLAAELHDSLSQNLSALACQVSAAKSTVTDGSETQSLLTTAERMLQSSRMELTRCLWDLRGDALEESDFTRAIENTLARLSLQATVLVRFNVPRARVDDMTAHAILCIVRELVTNAVKHGRAQEIRVAGETHDNVISFSVRDDGSGFDTEHANGIAEGHFGLEGIRDRVNRLDGTFEIESTPGVGTKAVVTLKMKDETTGNEFKA